MRWLVDGYNVIRRDPDLRGAEAAGLEAGRRALLGVIAEVARWSSDRFTVVFDGAPTRSPAVSPGRLEIIFSRPPQKADDVLTRLARQEGNGAVVVSSDRTVADAARRAGAVAVGAEAFLAALASGAEDDRDDAVEEDERALSKQGNPRRPSKDARAVERALRRLRPPRR